MPTASYTKITAAIEPLLEGINVGSDSWKIALTNASAVAKTSFVAGTDDLATGAGYTAGGNVLVVNTFPTTGSSGNTAYLSFSNTSWNAALTARGALIYLENGTTNPAVCILDFGSDKISNNTFTVQFPAATNTSAIIRIQ